MKRIIILCDGTWQNSLVQDDFNSSNITRIARAILPFDQRSVNESEPQKISQITYYHPGVGSRKNDKHDQLVGGAFGEGIIEQIRQVFAFISLNYEVNDELFFFGFSRGAYMVRSICGLILDFGILTGRGMSYFVKVFDAYTDSSAPVGVNQVLDSLKSKLLGLEGSFIDPKDIIVKFMGCFDTVGALGIPKQFSNQKIQYGFLNLNLNENVQNARQALSLDETRSSFEPTLWFFKDTKENRERYKQVWFTGVHINIGGGNMGNIIEGSDRRGQIGKESSNSLSDGSLIWMISEARSFLAFDDEYLSLNIFPNGKLKNDVDKTEGSIPAWFLGPIADNYHGNMNIWKMLGRTQRKVGRYEPILQKNEDLIKSKQILIDFGQSNGLKVQSFAKFDWRWLLNTEPTTQSLKSTGPYSPEVSAVRDYVELINNLNDSLQNVLINYLNFDKSCYEFQKGALLHFRELLKSLNESANDTLDDDLVHNNIVQEPSSVESVKAAIISCTELSSCWLNDYEKKRTNFSFFSENDYMLFGKTELKDYNDWLRSCENAQTQELAKVQTRVQTRFEETEAEDRNSYVNLVNIAVKNYVESASFILKSYMELAKDSVRSQENALEIYDRRKTRLEERKSEARNKLLRVISVESSNLGDISSSEKVASFLRGCASSNEFNSNFNGVPLKRSYEESDILSPNGGGSAKSGDKWITNEFIHQSVLNRNGPLRVGIRSQSLDGVYISGYENDRQRAPNEITIPVQKYTKFELEFFTEGGQKIN
ncbi:uncharacterized protein V1516DRAFT_666104 [Lipomyces oligophaga]|uniref:uncharacterized protein n=1 Tax=Lipomyces oligophaga TaxID=45792 RepID=UPI0034CF5073